VTLFAAAVINLRFALYSLSLSPHVRHAPFRLRLLLSYMLTDNGYAHAVARFAARPREPRKPDYLLGAETAIWSAWQAGTLAGVLAGASVSASWQLDFTVTLTFLALAVASIRDRATVAAACVAGTLAVAGHALPFRLGLPVAAVAGILAGLAYETWTRSRSPR
jgi:predicted branched-subunit amino acid permease